MTVRALYDHIRIRLKEAGIEEADAEARIILKDAAGIDRTAIEVHGEDAVDPEGLKAVCDIADRRIRREPLQYILGKWEFMGLEFAVNESTLIPRQDTEILVEAAMKELRDGMSILDLCTGTGCILISLLKYSNDCRGVGTDLSEGAVRLAGENAARILDDRTDVTFCHGDLYTGSDLFDIIVSNPPYIPTDVIPTLSPEVCEYEPYMALDGGADGLDLIKRIIDGASDHLIPGGYIFLEIGYDQGEAVRSLLDEAGFDDIRIIRDYAGLDRVAGARKPISL